MTQKAPHAVIHGFFEVRWCNVIFLPQGESEGNSSIFVDFKFVKIEKDQL